jgi:predicted nucleic acid-binding protein
MEEDRVRPLRNLFLSQIAEFCSAYRRIFTQPHRRRLPALDARRIAREHGLKTLDAIHLASAVRGDADQLLRWDDKFRLRERETYEGVLVREPYWRGQLEFDEEGAAS